MKYPKKNCTRLIKYILQLLTAISRLIKLRNDDNVGNVNTDVYRVSNEFCEYIY